MNVQLHAPASLSPYGNLPVSLGIRLWVDPRAVLDAVEESKMNDLLQRTESQFRSHPVSLFSTFTELLRLSPSSIMMSKQSEIFKGFF